MEAKRVKCPQCKAGFIVKVPEIKTIRTGAAMGGLKKAVGMFALGVVFEIVPSLAGTLGPHLIILMAFFAGEFVYMALTPNQWKALLGME